MNILIVEDEGILAMMLADVLEGLGHMICAIEATEAGAVVAAALFNPSMMIVDMHLRDGNGVSAVAAILRSGYIPHVFASGGRLSGPSPERGAVVLQKPYREIDLVLGIERALGAGAVR